VEEAAHLSHVRGVLVTAPHVEMYALRRHDERLAAHLDGIAVAGDHGWAACEEILEAGDDGAVFTVSVRAIEDSHAAHIDRMLPLAQTLPAARHELASALNWVSGQRLRGLTARLFASPDAVSRALAIVACAAHRVDPGKGLTLALSDADATLRACGLRAAGECGRQDLRDACADAARRDGDTLARFSAARSAVLLGERQVACSVLRELASEAGPHRSEALHLLLKVLPPNDAGWLLKRLSDEDGARRELLRAVGVAGDPHYMPWLIDRMREPDAARLAGEAFAMLTGCDLSSAAFIKIPPEDDDGTEDEEDALPEDASEDDDIVLLDEDDDLPEPDPDKISGWWQANGQRFAPGTRYFMGEPPSPSHCLSVLKSGFQRQRIAAAIWLCLLNPGTPLFNTAAPAWRQQQWLNAMTA